MSAEEFLNSKDVFNHPRITNRNKTDSFDVAELMDEYHKEQLRIGLVSQQRELLIAYENKVGHMDKDEAVKFVDEYLNSEGN